MKYNIFNIKCYSDYNFYDKILNCFEKVFEIYFIIYYNVEKKYVKIVE